MAKMFQEYLSYLSGEKNASPHTITAYQKDLEDFFIYLKKENLKETSIDHLDVRRYLMYLRQQGISNSSMARKLSSLRSYYHFLVRKMFWKIIL